MTNFPFGALIPNHPVNGDYSMSYHGGGGMTYPYTVNDPGHTHDVNGYPLSFEWIIFNNIINREFKKRPNSVKHQILSIFHQKSNDQVIKLIRNIFTDSSIEYYDTLSDIDLINYLALIV